VFAADPKPEEPTTANVDASCLRQVEFAGILEGTAHQAEAAALVPNAEVVLEPTYVTEALEPGYDVLACGPEPMLEAVRRLAPEAQLAWEAPMACGYGACYGCAVEIDGRMARLCVEGPVLGGHGCVPGTGTRLEGAAA